MSQTRTWTRGWAGPGGWEFTEGESAQGVVRRPEETAVLPVLPVPAVPDTVLSEREADLLPDENLVREPELDPVPGASALSALPVLPVLPAGWHVLRGVHWPDATSPDAGSPDRAVDAMDHLVVGPGGVFAVVDVDGMDHVIRADRNDPALAFVISAAVDVCLGAAAEVAEVVGDQGVRVHGLVRFLTEEHLAVSSRGAMVCTTRNVVQVLRSCPPVLEPAQVAGVLNALDRRLHPDPAEAPPAAVAGQPNDRTDVDDALAAKPGTTDVEEAARPGPSDRTDVAAAPAPAQEPATPEEATQPDDSGKAGKAAKQGKRSPGRAGRAGRRRLPFGRLVVGLAMVAGLAFAGPDLATKVGPTVADRLASLLTEETACAAVPPASKASVPGKRRTTATKGTTSKAATKRARAAGAKRAGTNAGTSATKASRRTGAKAAKKAAARHHHTTVTSRPRPSLVSEATPSC